MICRAEEDSLAEDPPAYNAIVARSFLIEVEPLVEKYTGWECEWPVPFRLVTRNEYIEQTMAEARNQLEKRSPGANPKLLDRLKPVIASQSFGLLGRYSTQSHQIYLLPGNLRPVMRDLGVEQRFTRDLVEVILAHELTHSVQDGKYKITERLTAAFSDDERTAWTMLIEGHATWVQERIAAELGLIESAQRFAAQMMARHQLLGTQGQTGIGAANTRGYLDGKTFVEAVYKKGGLKAVQRLFDNPPKSPRLIENPQEFFVEQGTP